MPEGKSIYDVAFGAGAETGKYSAELLKTEDVWERMAHRGKVTDWKIEQEATMADVAMDTLGLISEVYGGYKAGKEFEGALADTSERAAKTAYEKTGDKWSDLDPSEQEGWREKFKPEKKQQEWYEVLFGKEAEYKFGESDYFKKSSITASQALSEATSLEDMVDVEDWEGKSTMADDAGLSKGAKKKIELTDEEKAALKRSQGVPDPKKPKKKVDQNVVNIVSSEPVDWGDDPEKEDIPGLNIDPRMNKNPRKFY
jgi:hypothetical protein